VKAGMASGWYTHPRELRGAACRGGYPAPDLRRPPRGGRDPAPASALHSTPPKGTSCSGWCA